MQRYAVLQHLSERSSTDAQSSSAAAALLGSRAKTGNEWTSVKQESELDSDGSELEPPRDQGNGDNDASSVVSGDSRRSAGTKRSGRKSRAQETAAAAKSNAMERNRRGVCLMLAD